MVFLHILQNAALLIFSGLGAYAIFTNPHLVDRPRLQQVFLGLLMGVMLFLVTSSAYIIPSIQAPIDGKVGLLVFAGYLGGPLGALITAVFGSAVRISIGGPNVYIGIVLYFLFSLFGVFVSWRTPSRNWPQIQPKAIAALLIGGIAGQVLPLPFAIWDAGTEQTLQFLVVLAGMATASVLSIAILALTFHYAYKAAATGRNATRTLHRLALATRAADIGILERKAGSESAHFDDGMLRIFGLPKDTTMVSQADWERLILSEDLPYLKSRLAAVWSGRAPTGPTQFRIRRPDGLIRDIKAHWATEPQGATTVDLIIGIYEDVTASLTMEREKVEAESRLAKIIKNLPGAVHSIAISPEGEIELHYISPYCEKLWGHSQAEFMAYPKLFQTLHSPEDLPVMMETFRKAAITLKPFSRRFQINTQSGTTKWLEVHGSGTRFEGGTTRIDSIFLDVTAEVEAQQSLILQTRVSHQAQKNESIGQLTGGVAHDFNNLLAVIMGNLELLRDDTADPDHLEMIDAGIRATLRGADLTRSMLAFARKASLEPRLVDLNKLVRDTKNWTGRTLPASIRVESSLLAGLWPVEVDPSSAESALLNLILNARDAMDGDGRMTIETANVRITDDFVETRELALTPGRYVMLAISDTGSGISKEDIGNIFEPFFSTKSPGKGSGLGLSMVQGFMQQSGGTVQVYSEPGLGTTFKLYFKASHSTPPAATPPLPASGHDPAQSRILVAEDEPDVLNVLVQTLQHAGYDVTAAPSGDAAYAIYTADPTFDLLVTDIVMPGTLMGTDLAKTLRRASPDLPVIFMSGYASEAMVHGNGLHPDDIRLMKPVQRQDLLSAITTIQKVPAIT